MRPQGSFAYVDSTGTHLLALGALGDPSEIRGAICSTGLPLKVRYDRRQGRQKGDNGRQTVSNFGREEGDVFRVLDGTAQPDGTASCQRTQPCSLERSP